MSEYPSQYIKLNSNEMLVIRHAVPDDALSLIHYVKEVQKNSEYLVTQEYENTRTEVEQAQWILEYLKALGKIVLIAEIEGQVVGMLDFANGSRRRIQHVGSFGMSVRLAWRRKGVGRALLEALLLWASKILVSRR